MEFFKVYGEEDLRSFHNGTWGIREPSTEWQGGKRQNGPCSFLGMYRKLLNRPSVLDDGVEGLDVILLPGSYIYRFVLPSSRSTLPMILTLLQGVAFDRSLSRLGHGKGYYDKFLSSYATSGRQRPLLGTALLFLLDGLTLIMDFPVALSFREQLLAASHVPINETDWKMDMIISPDEVVVAENVA